MQYRNQYRFTGAIEKIFPEKSRTYKNKEGKMVTNKEREAVIVNKYKKNNYWRVSRALFLFKGEAAEKLMHHVPREEVIVSFSIRGVKWSTRDGEDKFFQKLEAWDIMSPKDRIMSESWMQAENFQIVKDPKAPDSSMSLTEEEKIKKRPSDQEYDHETFDPTIDYSNKRENVKEEDELPINQIALQENDLPF